jgi:myo-inositol-1(or 4)-monophosphatase
LSEELILKAIRENFSDHSILSEESGLESSASDFQWIVDPIDGTTNFTMHNPIWAISVALAHQGQVILGMVYAPVTDEFFVARLGEGVTLNGRPIKVSQMSLEQSLNTFCHGSSDADIARAVKYYNHQKLANFDCRQIGSASLELAYTACGRVESIIIPGANAWDVAAGVLLVKEAGGQVTDFAGQDWTLNSQDLCATNKTIHNQLIEILKNV